MSEDELDEMIEAQKTEDFAGFFPDADLYGMEDYPLSQLQVHKEICILVNLVIEYVYIINIFYFCKPMLY